MKKIPKIFIREQVEKIKGTLMKNSDKLPKLDPSKLKQIPDEVRLGDKIYRYGPEVEAYEEVVRELASGAMQKLREKFMK